MKTHNLPTSQPALNRRSSTLFVFSHWFFFFLQSYLRARRGSCFCSAKRLPFMHFPGSALPKQSCGFYAMMEGTIQGCHQVWVEFDSAKIHFWSLFNISLLENLVCRVSQHATKRTVFSSVWRVVELCGGQDCFSLRWQKPKPNTSYLPHSEKRLKIYYSGIRHCIEGQRIFRWFL